MKAILITVTFLIISHCTFSQAGQPALRMEKNFWGVKFWQGEKLLRPRQVLEVMKDNQPAYAEFKKAKSNYDAGQVFGAIGGFMIGWPIGAAIAGGKPEWGLAAGGVGVLLLSSPFSIGFTRHAKSAITLYNSGAGTANARPYSIHFVPYGTGANLVIRF